MDGRFEPGRSVRQWRSASPSFKPASTKTTTAGNSTWATGDWNGDAEFDFGDLVLAFQDGGYEQGPRAAVNAVPEPSSAILLVVGIICFCRYSDISIGTRVKSVTAG